MDALPHSFFFAAGHYPPEELVALGKHGEPIFFFEATELVWAIGIFWWPASFFFASSGAVLGVHVGVTNARGKADLGVGCIHGSGSGCVANSVRMAVSSGILTGGSR